MYTSGGHGLSFFLHLLAGYPKTALSLGLAGMMGLMSTPLGPGTYPGTRSAMERIESQLNTCANADDLTEKARRAVREEPELSDDAIKSVLRYCAECQGLTPAGVRKDPDVNETVKFLYYLNLYSELCVPEDTPRRP